MVPPAGKETAVDLVRSDPKHSTTAMSAAATSSCPLAQQASGEMGPCSQASLRKAFALEALLKRHEAAEDSAATATLGARVVRRARIISHTAPDVAESLYGMLGFAFWKLKRFHRAAEILDKQLALALCRSARESHIRARELLALCCVDLDRVTDALRHRHQIYQLTQQADDVAKQLEALTNLGDAYLRQGTKSCMEFGENCGCTGALNAYTNAIEIGANSQKYSRSALRDHMD